MKRIQWIVMGTVLGIALVLACGEATMHAVDAGVDAKAQSECTTCEKPLTGRVHRNYATKLESSNPLDGTTGVTVLCTSGANPIVVGGGCEITNPGAPGTFAGNGKRHLVESAPQHEPLPDAGTAVEAPAWLCVYDKTDADQYLITATVICIDEGQPGQ